MNGAPRSRSAAIAGRRAARIEPDGLDHVMPADATSTSGRIRIDVGGGADGVVNDRAFPLGKLEIEAQGLEDQEDVGEQDRGIDAQALGRGDRHFGRQIGPLAQFEERDLASECARYSAM